MPHDAGHGGRLGSCPRGQSRVCAHVAHIAYVYSRCVPPSLPSLRDILFSPEPPVLFLSRPPTPPCVICPPWRVPRAVSSAPAPRRPPPRRPPAPPPRRPPACPPPCRPLAPPPRPPPAPPPCRPPAPPPCRPPASRRPSLTSPLGPPSPRHTTGVIPGMGICVQ